MIIGDDDVDKQEQCDLRIIILSIIELVSLELKDYPLGYN